MFLRLYSKDIVKPMNMDYVFGIKTKYHRLCCFLVFFLEYREYKMSIFGICFILYAQLRFLKKYFRVSWEVPENASPCIKCKIYFKILLLPTAAAGVSYLWLRRPTEYDFMPPVTHTQIWVFVTF